MEAMKMASKLEGAEVALGLRIADMVLHIEETQWQSISVYCQIT